MGLMTGHMLTFLALQAPSNQGEQTGVRRPSLLPRGALPKGWLGGDPVVQPRAFSAKQWLQGPGSRARTLGRKCGRQTASWWAAREAGGGLLACLQPREALLGSRPRRGGMSLTGEHTLTSFEEKLNVLFSSDCHNT